MNPISDYISYQEATYSPIALSNGIDNKPNADELDNMRMIAEDIFIPLRAGLGNRPIHINSFFRSKELNKKIGGVYNSQHLCNNNCAAMDLDNDHVRQGPTNKEIFEYIRDYLFFDQLICEYPDEQGNPSWVHVSKCKVFEKNRMEVLQSEYIIVEGKRKRQYIRL